MQKYTKSMPKVCQEYATSVPNVCQKYANSMQQLCQKYAKRKPKVYNKYPTKMQKLCQQYAKSMQDAIKVWAPFGLVGAPLFQKCVQIERHAGGDLFCVKYKAPHEGYCVDRMICT